MKDFKEPYVLVSACRGFETTTELDGHGIFTPLLLDVLTNETPATYEGLIGAIAAKYQKMK